MAGKGGGRRAGQRARVGLVAAVVLAASIVKGGGGPTAATDVFQIVVLSVSEVRHFRNGMGKVGGGVGGTCDTCSLPSELNVPPQSDALATRLCVLFFCIQKIESCLFCFHCVKEGRWREKRTSSSERRIRGLWCCKGLAASHTWRRNCGRMSTNTVCVLCVCVCDVNVCVDVGGSARAPL